MPEEEVAVSSQAETNAAFRIAWSLFVAIETANQPVIDAIMADTDDDVLLTGWHVVAARLRRALREHAEHVGCDCGSDAWLEEERLHNAARED